MASIKKLKAGMTVWEVRRVRMGNTTMMSDCVYSYFINEVNEENKYVIASWNGNPSKGYTERSYKKWKLEKPVTETSAMGHTRVVKK